MRILVTGAAGALGRRVAQMLVARGHEVVGVDRRACRAPGPGVQFVRSQLGPEEAQTIFAEAVPEALVLLGGLHTARAGAHARGDVDDTRGAAALHATETLLRLTVAHGVRHVVLLSSGDVYGPSPANSHFLGEDAALKASQRFPAVRALVAVDRAVLAFGCRYPEVHACIVRPAHIVGPHLRNAASNYLRLPRVPTQMGFDPMLQLTSEHDVALAVVRCLQRQARGPFNLASTEPVPLSVLLRLLGKPTLPIPHPLFARGLGQLWRLGLTSFPPPELDHIRFHSVLDTTRAKAELGIAPHTALEKLLEPFVAKAAASPI